MAVGGGVISAVGSGLVELLKTKAGFAEGDIVMKSPDGEGKVSLFLYQVQENPYLRNRESEVIREAEDALRPPPMILDLLYLVTPLVAEPVTALGHMEAVMLAFYDHPVLRPPLLTPALVEMGNDAIKIVPHALSLDDTNKLWGMFPDKSYRLSVAYLVTPVRVPSGRPDVKAPRVVEKVTRFSRMEIKR
jgi:hypothetical protein